MAITFGRYRLLRKLASGGMGQVLLAMKGAKGFEKLVVIKRILPHLVEDEEFFQMFVDEATVAMRLDHPNIARINEFGEEQGVHFLEMEYISGEDIRRIEKRARDVGLVLPLGFILRVIIDAASGLDFAHKARDFRGNPLNIVHRDVSPQNILVGFDGSVKIIDFGVAKAAGRSQRTASGVLKGKFPYMSPEQAEGLDLDPRSDVFALGIVLWELLTGRRLFKGDNDLASQRLVRACHVVAPSSVAPSVPQGLDPIVMKALAKRVEDRYPDAASFRVALEDFALQNAISTSSSQLIDLLKPLYAERIERETDPESLAEDDAGLTGLEAGGLSARSPEARATVAAREGSADGRRGSEGQGRLSLGAVFVAVVLLLGLLGGGGAALWWAFGSQVQKPVAVDAGPVPATDGPAPVPPGQPDAAAASPPEAALFAIESEPSGAAATFAGTGYGTTPLTLKLPVGLLPGELQLTLEGYEAWKTVLTANGQRNHSVTLKKKRVAPPPSSQGLGIKKDR